MASGGSEDFEEWLCAKLKALNTDPDVFASYIKSILEGDETKEEKLDALEEILVEITEEDIPIVSNEIVNKWDVYSATSQNLGEAKIDVEARLASIMEKQAQPVVSERKLSEEERKYRENILAQYSQISDEEDETENCDYKGPTTSSAVYPSDPNNLSKNTNAEDVAKAERDKRDKAKAECEKKKAADKANKEKQKQQQQERKEKEKKRTQKGERKR